MPAPPAIMAPMSAEDFSRSKRRIVLKWLVVALLVTLTGTWLYYRSTSSQDSQKALSDGERMLKAGRYAEAIQYFDRAIAAQSGLANAYLMRGRAHTALNQTGPAIRDFTKVIQLQPGDPQAFLERAAVHLGTNDYAAAVADCGDAISRDPNLAYSYTLRGMAFREMGKFPRSLEDFNRALELSPGLDTYFQRATTYQALGEHTRAIADLDEVISRFPTSPLGYLARAMSREAAGDVAGARADREIVRQMDEQDLGR
jgi:tetratricopeptide (TPR) repeat protein